MWYELEIDGDGEKDTVHKDTVYKDRVHKNTVRLVLTDDAENLVGKRTFRLSEHDEALLSGLFEPGCFAARSRVSGPDNADGPESETSSTTRLGLFIGRDLLGEEIADKLLSATEDMELIVRIADPEGDPLARAVAFGPLELARLESDGPSLMDRPFRSRIETGERGPVTAGPVETPSLSFSDGPFKILLVCPDAEGCDPVGLRTWRRRLLSFFQSEMSARKNVRIDTLCCGVDRRSLCDQVRFAGGYHAVHWCGRAVSDGLVVRGEHGGVGHLSAKEFAGIFEREGGFFPELAFLTPCNSEKIERLQDRESVEKAWATAREPLKVLPDPHELLEGDRCGFSKFALELCAARFPRAAVLKHEVSLDFALELTFRFYSHLFAEDGNRSVQNALIAARRDLMALPEYSGRNRNLDLAAPVLVGRDARISAPNRTQAGRSETVVSRVHRLAFGSPYLDPVDNFVGRGDELVLLKEKWLLSEGPGRAPAADGVVAVALLQGLAGMGKTALAAEAVDLWKERFDHVICFQSRDTETTVEEFYGRIHRTLGRASEMYKKVCREFPEKRIYFPCRESLSGDVRLELMRGNLANLLREGIFLIVLDNFEKQLEERPEKNLYRCKDRQWDCLLEMFARKLGGSRSRVLITSRRRPAALKGAENVLWIPLGPLSLRDAIRFAKSGGIDRGSDTGGASPAERMGELLEICRGHPMMLETLGALAARGEYLPEVVEAFKTNSFRTLPDIFAQRLSDRERGRELEFLERASARAADLAIERLSPEARNLLWIAVQGIQPVERDALDWVRSGKTPEDDKLARIRQLYQLAEKLPDDLRRKMPKIPPKIAEMMKDEKEATHAPPMAPFVSELCDARLLFRREHPVRCDPGPVAAGKTGGDQDASGKDAFCKDPVSFSFHDVTRERAEKWFSSHEEEKGGRGKRDIHLAYMNHYEMEFMKLRSSECENSVESAAEAAARALSCMVGKRIYSELGPLAYRMAKGLQNPAMLKRLLEELQIAADKIPDGKERWRARGRMAEALKAAEHSEQAIALFEQAAAEARAAGHWDDVGRLLGDLANGHRQAEDLDSARRTHLAGAEAYRAAGSPEIQVVANELEALRIEVYQGRAERVLPEIDDRLEKLKNWWDLYQAGAKSADAPDPALLARALVSGLDIAEDACRGLKRWQACLDLLDEIEAVEAQAGGGRLERHATRFNRYGPLVKLGRLDEAQETVEQCLGVYREGNDLSGAGQALSALAEISAEKGELPRAIEAESEALAIWNKFSDIEERSVSHGNLSRYYFRQGRPDLSARHLAATLIYRSMGEQESLFAVSLGLAKQNILESEKAGGAYELPPVSDLVRRPEFEALSSFLKANHIDLAELQGIIDSHIRKSLEESRPTPQIDLQGIPPELGNLFTELAETCAAGKDISDVKARLKKKFIEMAPGMEKEIDTVIHNVIEKLTR